MVKGGAYQQNQTSRLFGKCGASHPAWERWGSLLKGGLLNPLILWGWIFFFFNVDRLKKSLLNLLLPLFTFWFFGQDLAPGSGMEPCIGR